MEKEVIYQKIIDIMERQKLISKNDIVDCEADLFDTYNINSIVAIQLLIEIESVFNITLDDNDLLPQTYQNLNSLIKVISNYFYK